MHTLYIYPFSPKSTQTQKKTKPNPIEHSKTMKSSSRKTLEKLEYLSVVSKVCTELESHLGFADKVLAEYLISLGHESLTVDEFHAKLNADLSFYFASILFNIIHASTKPNTRDDHVKAIDKEVTLKKSENKSRVGRIKLDGVEDLSRRPFKKKMSSPERWDVNQLIASGVLSVKDYPMHDEGTKDGMVYQEEGGDDEELEVELNEDEPAFLKGLSHYSMDMSPVKIVKNPEGSLSRAAALQSALIKERREVRDQEKRTMLDSIPKDLNRPWEDPMPENGERHLAQELRGVGFACVM